MKFRITLKDPDGVYQCISDAADQSMEGVEGVNEPEWNTLHAARSESILEAASKWVKHDEYVTIEIDTDEKTAIVIPARP
jgi:hypothetical protein